MSGDMHPYAYPTSPENGDRRAVHSERHDELGSQSGSDEGSTAQYTDSFRNDDFDDDPEALTNQTLNADGTPKRPMNAFMIFARRRRPQVSAENQAMRTGEISKILSKEWSVMAPSEKQFYLDRAKQLKETFNTKYPDYVYRRRPNNSRKKSKRRLDPSMGCNLDPRDTPDAADDFRSVSAESHVHHESEDRHYEGGPSLVSRLDYLGTPHARTGPYHYVASDSQYRHNGSHDPRISFLSSPSERLSNDAPNTAHRLSHSESYGYVPLSGHAQGTQLYSTDSGNARDSRWGSRVGNSGWPHERQMAGRYGSGTPTSWSGATGVVTGGSTQAGNFVFPTLTAPFYPGQAHMQSYQAAGSSSHPDTPARYESPAGQSHQNAGGHSQSYGQTPSMAPENAYSNDTMMYQQRLASMPRGLPPVQSLANYAQSPHPASSGTNASQGY